jgi:hypothetical protein
MEIGTKVLLKIISTMVRANTLRVLTHSKEFGKIVRQWAQVYLNLKMGAFNQAHMGKVLKDSDKAKIDIQMVKVM